MAELPVFENSLPEEGKFNIGSSLRPYVGVTGLTNLEEVIETISIFNKYGFDLDSRYIPMTGFLVSHKNLDSDDGKHPTSNRYPLLPELPDLLEEARGKAFPTIHYNTKENKPIGEEILKLFDKYNVYSCCEGVQLNKAWPDPKQIEIIKESYPDLPIIVQVRPEVMDDISLTEKVIRNYPDVEYLLIDGSMGRGIPLNPALCVKSYKRMRAEGVQSVIGFAGGLNGGNVEDIIRDFKKNLGDSVFPIDAEGGLRDSDDNLDIDRVEAYIHGSARGHGMTAPAYATN